MDCTITTTKTKGRTGGMTLVEIMVSMGISGLVFAAVASQIFYSGRSYAALANYVDLDIYSRNALDKMTSEIRQANRVISCTSTSFQIEAVDAGAGTTNTLTYAYDATSATLKRIYVGQTNTVLKEVLPNTLRFDMYQRNTLGGSVDNYPTTNAAECKVVQLSWVCSRKILGQQANTESVQSAKIMIRKQ